MRTDAALSNMFWPYCLFYAGCLLFVISLCCYIVLLYVLLVCCFVKPSLSAQDEPRIVCIIRSMLNIDAPTQDTVNLPVSRPCSDLLDLVADKTSRQRDNFQLIYEIPNDSGQKEVSICVCLCVCVRACVCICTHIRVHMHMLAHEFLNNLETRNYFHSK